MSVANLTDDTVIPENVQLFSQISRFYEFRKIEWTQDVDISIITMDLHALMVMKCEFKWMLNM